MLKFDPNGFDTDFFSNPDLLDFTEQFDAPSPSDGGVRQGLWLDNPLTGLSLPLDGGDLDLLFSDGEAATSSDYANHVAGAVAGFDVGGTSDAPVYSFSMTEAFGQEDHGYFVSQMNVGPNGGIFTVEVPLEAVAFNTEMAPAATAAAAVAARMAAAVVSGDPDVLSSYLSGDPGGYNIEINFKGSWTFDLQQAFIDASELISDIILGDIGDVRYRGGIIDDIRIDAKLSDIDGVGNILGQAGPTAIRTADYLPATAIMEFDIADADNYNTMPSGSEGTLWDDIVVHEMLHSIGFGTIWSYLNLLSGAGTSDPRFMGANAIAAYNDSGGTVDGGVQVEGSSYAGPGTRDSHRDEDAFGNELMTGYINNSDNYLSNMTIASLEDLDYDTIYIG